MGKLLRERNQAEKLVFVSGNFNILHPGHQRLLKFAADCGEKLIVGVNNDQSEGAHIPEDLRLEGVRAISWVDEAFIIQGSLDQVILSLQPDVVVKGKEHEQNLNIEESIVSSYGGKLVFSSGETRFTSLDLIRNEFLEADFSSIKLPEKYLKRHEFSHTDLLESLTKIANVPALVIGDIILDEYISCEPLGMSQEDPTIVVSPLSNQVFLGGAGIVAAHAKGLGAKVTFLSVVGSDPTSKKLEELLEEYGVDSQLFTDESRPTTLKQRFRADSKTLLRVNHLKQHDIPKEIQEQIYSYIEEHIKELKLLIFSDFNYGCLPQTLVDQISKLCLDHDVMMVADSQSSSQIGDISRFHNMNLITPTEREARLAVKDSNSGLVVLAEKLRTISKAENVLLTLGREGVLVQSKSEDNFGLKTDKVPAMNTSPKDNAGAGDSLLTCCSLVMAAGVDIWQAAYLGSVAAACQVGRIGNKPLSLNELVKEITNS
ncbi:PfkB family carbohydrate kinase [Lentisphaera marina]|uniref:PfkB family carbohydrate kinase n=1 Tax=Lentisphaera marina TaxID=1111041 RepID=UPI00236639CF|nr:PfkB family carbohydrate kinase [Lentisphaera marina]MDD7985733.1 PfkB family carbohydrate kinase [Lentisphaera marina]